jgi:uncharacterized protein
MSLALGVALFAIALGAFATEAALGFGATVVALSLAAQLVSIDLFLPAFVPVNVVLLAWILVVNRRKVAWRQLVAEVAPAVAVGVAIGLVLFRIPARLGLQMTFAASVVLLSLLELRRLRAAPSAAGGSGPDPAAPRGSRWRSAPLLVLGGVAHGLFSTGGPMIVYVLRRRLADKGVFRASLAALWIALSSALLVNYATMGLYSGQTGQISLVLAAAVVPGILIGERLHRALDPAAFHRIVLVVLLASALVLAVRTGLQLAG